MEEENVAAAPVEETAPVVAEAPETVKKYEALEPVLDALAEQCGVEPGSGEALLEALKARKETGKEVMDQVRAGADRIYDGWMQAAEQLKQVYPEFDLRREMADPRFARLLGARVDMQTAFEVLHNREIIPAAMEYAAKTIQQHMASAMRSGTDRPAENGLRGSGAVMLGSDVKSMSKKDIAAICKMVERGERVSFG